jgi:sialate O-acetylesterase
MSAVAYAFSVELQELLDVPVGVIVTCWGSSSIEGWMPLDLTEKLPHFKTMMEQFEKNDRQKGADLIAKQKWERKENIYLRTRPNILYNAIMHPLAPVACRGLVWYQGESNSGRYQTYGDSIKLWTERLRQEWKNDQFHLLAVMLPGFARGEKDPIGPDQESWAWMREKQLELLNLANTGVANTIDLGDAKDIHPKDKAPIGKRLALLAARDVNGKKIVGEGPTLTAAKIDGVTMRLSFHHSTGLKTSDGNPPREFWIAGADKKWRRATATIKGDDVVVSAADVRTPQFVRYAWSGKPDVNLVNGASLPALPFRTDK